MGSLAAEKPEHGKPLSGILIKRGFNYHLIAPEDLQSKSFYPLKIFFLLLSLARRFYCGKNLTIVVGDGLFQSRPQISSLLRVTGGEKSSGEP